MERQWSQHDDDGLWRGTRWCRLLRSRALKFRDTGGIEEWREQGDEADRTDGKAGKKEEAAELQGTDEDRKREREGWRDGGVDGTR